MLECEVDNDSDARIREAQRTRSRMQFTINQVSISM